MNAPHRVLGLVAGAVLLSFWAIGRAWQGAVGPDFWCCFAACFAGELLWVRLPLGRATVSMASCFQFATLLLLPSGQAMAITAITGLVAEWGVMRKPPLRAVFNAAQASLAVGAAASVLHALAGGRPVGELVNGFHLLPLLLAGLTYFAVNTGAVSMAVALNDRIDVRRAWQRNFGGAYELASNGALFSLGVLLASQYAASGPGGAVLIVLPLLVAYEGYRRVTVSRCVPGEGSHDASSAVRPVLRAAIQSPPP